MLLLLFFAVGYFFLLSFFSLLLSLFLLDEELETCRCRMRMEVDGDGGVRRTRGKENEGGQNSCMDVRYATLRYAATRY
ncbi:hypothetical protein BKA80DRAFT_24435 [Phyllosticta citrichinensis]